MYNHYKRLSTNLPPLMEEGDNGGYVESLDTHSTAINSGIYNNLRVIRPAPYTILIQQGCWYFPIFWFMCYKSSMVGIKAPNTRDEEVPIVCCSKDITWETPIHVLSFIFFLLCFAFTHWNCIFVIACVGHLWVSVYCHAFRAYIVTSRPHMRWGHVHVWGTDNRRSLLQCLAGYWLVFKPIF